MKKNSSLAETIKKHDILTRLLFEWPIKTAPRIALPLFIFLAALLHLSTVYFFNIVYEPPHVSKSTAAQIFFLVPNSLASQQLAPWLQANDPSIFSPLKTVQTNQPKIPASIYQLKQPPPTLHPLPSCEVEKMKSLLPPTDELVLPPTADVFQNATAATNGHVTPNFIPAEVGIVPLNSSSTLRDAASGAPAPSPAPASFEKSLPLSALDHVSTEKLTLPSSINKTTTIHLLENSAARAPNPMSGLGYPHLPPGINAPLHPTMLTVNIDPSGIPHHVLITQSSGNEATDESAVHWLMTRHFAPAEEETWGKVLIFWGNE
jgi:hypothetical protein